MQIPHIPVELIHEILAHLHLPGEKRTLENCSLVCKSWVHPSRSRLFAKITIDDNLVKRFLAISQRSTVLDPYIRRFHLRRFGPGEIWNGFIPDLELVGFRGVTSLTLSHFDSHILSTRAPSALFSQFTGIVRFFLAGSHHLHAARFAEIICCFPRLEVLGLSKIPLDWSTCTVPPRTISRHLHTLEICDHHAMKLLAWILSFENLPELRVLYLNWSLKDCQTLNDLLPNLRFLERLSLYNQSLLFESIDLSHQERLRSLHLRAIPSWYSTKSIIQTLTSITSSSMSKVTFDVITSWDKNNDDQWTALDAVLQSRPFSNLRTVQVNVISRQQRPFPSSLRSYPAPRLSTRFPVLFPQCYARRILSVHQITYASSDVQHQFLSM